MEKQMSDRDSAQRSKLPMSSIVLGVLSFLGFAVFPLFALSIPALTFAMLFLITIRHQKDRRRWPALLGVILSVAALSIAPFWYIHLYDLETAPEHERVEFANIGSGAGLDSYNGRRICLKGYAISNNPYEPTATIFISPDGDRCSLTTIVSVRLPFLWQHTELPVAVSGVLIVSHQEHYPRYTIEAIDVRPANTQIGLLERVPSFGC